MKLFGCGLVLALLLSFAPDASAQCGSYYPRYYSGPTYYYYSPPVTHYYYNGVKYQLVYQWYYNPCGGYYYQVRRYVPVSTVTPAKGSQQNKTAPSTSDRPPAGGKAPAKQNVAPKTVPAPSSSDRPPAGGALEAPVRPTPAPKEIEKKRMPSSNSEPPKVSDGK